MHFSLYSFGRVRIEFPNDLSKTYNTYLWTTKDYYGVFPMMKYTLTSKVQYYVIIDISAIVIWKHHVEYISSKTIAFKN